MSETYMAVFLNGKMRTIKSWMRKEMPPKKYTPTTRTGRNGWTRARKSMTDRLLMIFVKNPELGKVKTRLASTLGDEKALEIYLHLLDHSRTISLQAQAEKAVFYSSFIDNNDNWNEDQFHKFVQEADDLGDRMANAFKTAFGLGYRSVVIMGSDCLEMTPEYINQAFEDLENNDVCIGPAKDGGYVLLGMHKLHPQFFLNKTWSTDEVFPKTLQDIQSLKLSYSILPILSDVDYEEDLAHMGILNKKA